MKDQIIRVLLVEDSDTEAAIICECLKPSRFGRFEVARADRMASALDLLKKSQYDVVLLDLTLPDSHALATFPSILPLAKDAGIIVLTSTDSEAVAVCALKDGAQDYQIKGQINEKEFQRAVRYAFERKQFENELRKKNAELEAQAWGMAKANDGVKALYKDLEKKNAEIEKSVHDLKVFNDLCVDREERILELKAQVESLKAQLANSK